MANIFYGISTVIIVFALYVFCLQLSETKAETKYSFAYFALHLTNLVALAFTWLVYFVLTIIF